MCGKGPYGGKILAGNIGIESFCLSHSLKFQVFPYHKERDSIAGKKGGRGENIEKEYIFPLYWSQFHISMYCERGKSLNAVQKMSGEDFLGGTTLRAN